MYIPLCLRSMDSNTTCGWLPFLVGALALFDLVSLGDEDAGYMWSDSRGVFWEVIIEYFDPQFLLAEQILLTTSSCEQRQDPTLNSSHAMYRTPNRVISRHMKQPTWSLAALCWVSHRAAASGPVLFWNRPGVWAVNVSRLCRWVCASPLASY